MCTTTAQWILCEMCGLQLRAASHPPVWIHRKSEFDVRALIISDGSLVRIPVVQFDFFTRTFSLATFEKLISSNPLNQ